jgi:RNA polymerase sigma factor (sigma-70 family)
VWKRIRGDPAADPPEVNWAAVVEQIQSGDPAAEECLYKNLVSGARLFLQRRLGRRDVEDRLHDLFVIIVETIRRGDLREPERLMGFVRTVLNRQLSAEISQIVRSREHSIGLDGAGNLSAAEPSPEEQAAMREKVTLMKQALQKMSKREFEVLTRFYLREQPPERIRLEMGLTETQFHLIKSRAKARLTRSIRQNMSRHPFIRR